MTFQDLRFNYQSWRNDTCQRVERVENKQRLNLSDQAYAVLMNDTNVFRVENSAKRKSCGPSSHIINHIFSRFRETAHSSIALACHIREIDLENALAQVQPDTARKCAVKLLLDEYRTQLVDELQHRMEKGNAFYFRINMENLDYLASEEGQRESTFYDGSVGKYFKAILEEYAEYPLVERERIYLKDILDKIQLATSKRKILKLTMHSVNKTRSGTVNNILYVKPLGVQPDLERLYHYLVGMKASCKDGPWTPGAIRLTAIKNASCLEQPAVVSKAENKIIENEMRKHGVQYLSDNRSAGTIKVRFTPEGEKMYYQMLHLRPLYTANPEPLVYEFSCTRFQAETYFFRFGHNVKILEPKDLADKFMRRYQSAAKQYQDET